MLTENGRLLTLGLDYVFGFSNNNRTIRLTPLSGFWRQDSVYEMTLNNKPRVLINAPNGQQLLDGTVLTATLPNGVPVNFEFEAGFVVQVPQTSTLVVPANGSRIGGVVDGQSFDISVAVPGPLGSLLRSFEFDTDGIIQPIPNRVRIPIAANASASAVRDAILTALESQAGVLQLNAKAVGTDRIHLGTNANHSIVLGTSSLTLEGILSGIEDGQSFRLPVRLERARDL